MSVRIGSFGARYAKVQTFATVNRDLFIFKSAYGKRTITDRTHRQLCTVIGTYLHLSMSLQREG